MSLSTVSDEQVQILSKRLYDQLASGGHTHMYASTKQILALFGIGATISASFLKPAPGRTDVKDTIDAVNESDVRLWRRYSTGYLKQSLKRLETLGLVETATVGTKKVLRISRDGKEKLLSFLMEHIHPKMKNKWDKKWRIILYDIDFKKRNEQQAIRRALKNLGFRQMQKSVYISPFPCDDEVGVIRSFFGLGNDIKYMVVDKISDDTSIRQMFGL